MKKRILSMLLALALCLTLLPTAALAAEGESGGSTTPTLGDKLTLEAVEGTEGFSGEGYGNLVDGKNTAENWTKWCFTWNKGTGGISDYLIGYYVILKAESAVKISGYSFTTGNDNAQETGRNPKSWTLYGSDSQDGSWTEIAAVTDDTTMQNQNFAKFDFVLTAAPDAYQYYKFVFTANQGASVMQLSEIALYGPVCEHEWKNEGDAVAATCTEDGYQLQRCVKCGSTKRANVVPATGHEYNNGPECSKCGQMCCATLTTKDNDVSYYENIKDALDAAQRYDGCTVKLYSKATYDKDAQYMCWGTFTIDLNGQQAAIRLRIRDGSNITLINTAEKQATFGDDSIEFPVVSVDGGTVTVGRSDGSDGNIRFQKQGGTWPSDETFLIGRYGNASLYGGSYMKFSCDEKAKLYYYLPAGFAFADSAGNEVDATGYTLSEVHIVRHTEHHEENGVCTICGACDHPADSVDEDSARCTLCGRTMLARVALGENVTYFSDLNEAISKATETDGCTLKLLANAGALTVSKGAFTLDLNDNTADSLTVSGGSIKLTNAKKIGTLTVSGDVTLASLLPEGYAFCKSLYNWYSTGDLVEMTSLSDVSVRQIPLKDLTVKADKESYVYGDDIKLTASVTKVGEWNIWYYWYEGKKSLGRRDNPLVIEKPTVGTHTYTCTVQADNGYSLSTTITVNVTPKRITGAKVTLEQDSLVYDGAAKTPTVSEVKLGETTLTSADYDVTVTPQTNVGSGYTVTVTGKGNYTGTASASWSITAKTVTNPTIELSGISFPYDNGNEIKPAVTVKDGETIISADEYTVSYTNNINVGTATVTVKDKEGGNYTVSGSTTFAIGRASFTAPTVTMSGYTYGGTLPTPSVGEYPGGGAVTYYYNTANGSSAEWKDMTATSLNVGTYSMYAVIAESQNYTSVTTQPVEFTVSAATVTVTAKDKTAYIGGTAPDLSKPEKDKDYTITGLFGEDTLTGEVTLKYDPEKPDMTKTGEAAIKISGTLANDNYDVAYADGKLTITTRPSSGGGSSTAKTETTTNPDGSTTKTETKADGTVVETTTGKDGSVSKTETKKDGSSVTENKDANGSTGTVKTDKNGSTEAEAKISEKAVADAKKSGEAVKIPAEVKAGENSSSAPTVKVELPKNAGETKIEIPVKDVSGGTVAVIVHPDGTEEIVKDSLPTENGIQLTVSGDTTVKIVDNSKGFVDINGHWAEDSINFVSARELVNGIDATHYAPDAATTRAQLWTILARQHGADLTGGANWYEKAQAWSVTNGISDGTNPNGTITRAQMVTMLWRAADSPAVESKTGFTDVPADSYYSQAVAWAVENSITVGVGDGRFAPNATCTRAQIAVFLLRAAQR